MRVNALVIRILRQIVRDKRTMALLIFAPILILTMMHLVFNGDDYVPEMGLVDVPDQIEKTLDLEDAIIFDYENRKQAEDEINQGKLDGYLLFEGSKPTLYLEGSDPNINSSVMKWVQNAFKPLKGNTVFELEVEYLYGSSDMRQFDYFYH